MAKCIPAELPKAETVSAEAIFRSLSEGETDLVCVLGPTASGKTKFAVRLACALDRLSGKAVSEIISADSRQVYRGMDIGTGKDLSEYGDIPFHLIDIEDPGTQYNVHRFQEDFNRCWSDIRKRGGIPILCGGTGLYINAVTAGYDFVGKQPLSAPRGCCDCTGPSAQPSCGQRNQASPKWPLRPAGCPDQPLIPSRLRTCFIGTLVDRETRNARIDARLDARLESGMIDEIRGLLDGTNPGCAGGKPVPPEVLLGYGLEYKYVTMYLQGQLDYDGMRSLLATAIHQFAKRQMTWFRGMERSGCRIHWVDPESAI